MDSASNPVAENHLQLPKCSLCNRPLSVSPVLYNDDNGSLCGRCTSEADEFTPWERQTLLEIVSKVITMPCSFEVFGCTAELQWDNVESHEESCPFKNTFCPLSHEFFQKKCSWIDKHDNLAKHIRQKHKSMFSASPTVNISKDFQNTILFWELTGKIVIIMLVFNNSSNKYYCYVLAEFGSELCRLYRCRVSVASDEMTSPLFIGHVEMQPFHGKFFDNQKNRLEINGNVFEELLATKNNVTFTIDFSKPVFVHPDSVPNEMSDKILQELECPICTEYMKPPIFICSAGHNICSGCHEKVNQCPLCRGNFLGGRNFVLENLTSSVNYPCENTIFGCHYAAQLERVQEHQIHCYFIGINCFVVDCLWKGRKNDIRSHLEENHPNQLLRMNAIKIIGIDSKDQHFILLHNDNYFVLKCRFTDSKNFNYAVVHCLRETTTYSYELKIMCSYFGMNITLSNRCEAVSSRVDVRKFNELPISNVPLSLVGQNSLHAQQAKITLNVMS